jgi:uncharacterized membrane protein
MANQQSLSPFQEVHKRIQEARERGRKERERNEAFWSISLYNGKGYFQQNLYNAYSVNDITAKKARAFG